MKRHKEKMAKRVIGFFVCIALVGGLISPMEHVAFAAAKPKLNASKLRLSVGKTATLKIKGIKAKKIKKATFTSKNKSIAKVSRKGKVTAVKTGKTQIIVKVQLKNKKKYTLKCQVVVKGSTPTPVPTSTSTQTPTSVPAPTSTPAPTSVPTQTPTPAPTQTPGAVAPPSEDDIIPEDKTPDASGKFTNAAFQMLHNMGIGINLGNTMESAGAWINPASVSNYETAWGSPIITKEMIRGMHNAGFETLRVPVAWSNMMSKDGKYTIHPDYFKRIDEILGWALEEDMYVILNIHWDGGWWGGFGSAKFKDEAWKHYESFWTQLSNHYKNYSNHLIFESANEELGESLNEAMDAQGNYYEEGGTKGTLTEDQCYETVNAINQKFVDIVRASGGKNEKRFLLIAGYDTDISKTCDARYKMPKDTIADRMMVSIHYYNPVPYCLADEPDNSWGFSDTWGTEVQKKELRSELRQMKLCFSDRGIPVIIGEYGVADKKVNNVLYRKENRNLFFEEVCKYAIGAGMCPVLWDITDHVYHRTEHKIIYEDEAQAFLSLAGQAKSMEPYRYSNEEIKEYVWNGTVGCEKWNPTGIISDEDSTFFMTSVGGCYQITGIAWDELNKPVLKLHSDSLKTSTGYFIGVKVTGNEYWKYIDDADVQMKGTWNMGSDLTIDLSTLGLSGKQKLYISLKGENDFSGKIRLTVEGQ